MIAEKKPRNRAVTATKRREVQVGKLNDGRYGFVIYTIDQVAVSPLDHTRQLSVRELFVN